MHLDIIARYLVIVGAAIFLILGILHGILTLQDLSEPRTFTPPDKVLRQAMQESSIAIHPHTNLWQAWLGFNLSHSLGLVMFGGTFLAIGLFYFQVLDRSYWLQCCAIFIATTYLVMSLKFWFYKPAIASSIALTCFVLASGLLLLKLGDRE
ncbi:LIC_13387 family protein [Chamaesiphon sp. VAR_48_metabat_403]|uniref:LIC_13387 family protein n=1 Tax=Chamaesiphon sp. VAR_48_metabat_403 TaxID=2964700 RepID=UPI00286D9B9C|nr:hypothetical protein [Chamaesiphon sp. VAR_48_metabat_403]